MPELVNTLKYVTGPITKADMGGLEAVISTPRVDKDGESVDPLGLINRDEWLTNPLIYWAHEWALDPTAEPIGKGTRLDVAHDSIFSAGVYAPTKKAQNVRSLVVGGFVRKTSIGFDPLEMKSVAGVPTHSKWALREWSVVPMPANTEATITGVKSALRWFSDWIVVDETGEDDDGNPIVELNPADLVTPDLALANEGREVVVMHHRRIIARLRPRRVLTLR